MRPLRALLVVVLALALGYLVGLLVNVGWLSGPALDWMDSRP